MPVEVDGVEKMFMIKIQIINDPFQNKKNKQINKFKLKQSGNVCTLDKSRNQLRRKNYF